MCSSPYVKLIELTLTIEPPPRSPMTRAAACERKYGTLRSIVVMRSQVSRSISRMGILRLTAALLTSTSSPPNRSRAASTMRCDASASPRSQGKALTSTCAGASPPAGPSGASPPRSVTSTEAPAAPRPAASQLPMPPAAPVTTAVFPSRENARPGARALIASGSNAGTWYEDTIPAALAFAHGRLGKHDAGTGEALTARSYAGVHRASKNAPEAPLRSRATRDPPAPPGSVLRPLPLPPRSGSRPAEPRHHAGRVRAHPARAQRPGGGQPRRAGRRRSGRGAGVQGALRARRAGSRPILALPHEPAPGRSRGVAPGPPARPGKPLQIYPGDGGVGDPLHAHRRPRGRRVRRRRRRAPKPVHRPSLARLLARGHLHADLLDRPRRALCVLLPARLVPRRRPARPGSPGAAAEDGPVHRRRPVGRAVEHRV